MKKLLLIALALLSVSSFALNEGLSNADLIQISADKDVQLQSLKQFFVHEKMNADGIVSDEEGKIVAAMIDSISREFKAVEKVLFDEVQVESDLRRIDFNDIQVRLNNIRALIEEINP